MTRRRVGASPQFAVIGLGGLGCPAALGLVAGGARSVLLVDHDRVELSNLQRQVLYETAHIGLPKVIAAADALGRRAPDLEIHTERMAVQPQTVGTWLASLPPQTIVLEATDRPDLKFAVNDHAVSTGRRVVIGAALGWRAQAMAVAAKTACYRCIYEAPPPPELTPTCADAGVLGAAVGTAGFVMATLALGLCADRPVAGRLWALDLRHGTPTVLHPRPRLDCPAHRAAKTGTVTGGPSPTIWHQGEGNHGHGTYSDPVA